MSIQKPGARLYLPLFLTTAATLLLELSLTRLFSVLMYYHFAFLAVSLALFGLAAAGLFLHFRRAGYTREKLEAKLVYVSIAFALTTLICLFVTTAMRVEIDYTTTNVLRLCIIYLVSLAPFFFSGLVVSALIFVYSDSISSVYFVDLIGAAVGAVLTVPLLNTFGPLNSLLLVAALAATSASLFCLKTRMFERLLALGVFVATIGLLVLNLTQDFIGLHFYKGKERHNIEYSDWNALSLITVEGAPGQNFSKSMEIDADARTYILRDPFGLLGPTKIQTEIASGWVSHYGNILLDSAEVLIIGPGGGMDVVFALAWGAKHIDAVEINPSIVNGVMKGAYREFSGDIYSKNNVTVHTAEGRSFLSRSDQQYDFIQLTLVDTWAASSAGAFSLSENNLYTVEAFRQYYRHLKRGGILSVTRWLTPKRKESLRLFTLALEAAEQEMIHDPASRFVLISAGDDPNRYHMMTMLFKKSGFAPEEMRRLKVHARDMNNALLYYPETPDTNLFTLAADPKSRDSLIAAYQFNLTPPTDDRPFFFNTARFSEVLSLAKLDFESRKNNLGLFNLYVAATLSLLLVVILLVVPLWFQKRQDQLSISFTLVRSVSYFIFIGLGFILIEIALMQKLILYLGHPIYALAVVLTTLLVAAGLGALSTNQFNYRTSRRYGLYLFPTIVVVLLVTVMLLPVVTRVTFEWPLWLRLVGAIVMTAPIGFLLGQPFPLEIIYLDVAARRTIPWCWSLNGAASVLGSVIAIAAAMSIGFQNVLLLGAGCYVLAYFSRNWSVSEKRLD